AQRIAIALESLDRDRRRAAEHMGDDEIGAEPLRDVERLRADVQARRRHREYLQLIALAGGKVLEHWQRLPACGIVVHQIGDLLALEAAAELVLRVLHGAGGLRPIAGGEREHVWIALSIRRRADAEAWRRARHLVAHALLGERLYDRGAIDAHRHGASLLLALIGLHAGRNLVLIVDVDQLDLVALDAALAVDEVHVVVDAGAHEHADVFGGTRAVALLADHQLLLLRARLR